MIADRYARARRLIEPAVRDLVRNPRPVPHWLPAGGHPTDDADAFWYVRDTSDGPVTVRVAPFSQAPPERFEPPRDAPAEPSHLVSPDGRLALTRDGFDLALVDRATGERRMLTSDGDATAAYGASPGSSLFSVTARRTGQPAPPVAVWSPDSRRVLTHRLDERDVPELALLQHVPGDGWRPKVWTTRTPFVGDPVATAQLVVVDIATGAVRQLADPLLVEFLSPLELGWVRWDASGELVWLLREERGATRLRLQEVDVDTGRYRTVVDESASDYVEPSALLPWTDWTQVRHHAGRREVVWLSERDGWAHLYLYDADTGAVVRRLTKGPWTVLEVRDVPDPGFVYFVGAGREEGRNPYQRCLYRVPATGGDVELLTPEPGDHVVTFSPSGRCFVDTCSTPAAAPVTRLRAADGTLLRELETADLSGLYDLGWTPPQPVRVTAADGQTPLYGLLFLPSDFDPTARYPLIDSLYPGPQLIRTPTSFTVDSFDPHDWPGAWDAQALAELGFAVLTLDGRGTPMRSRAFHHHSSGRLQAAGELDDHVAALRQIAADRPYLDLTRVGVVGHSAGGYAAARAMLLHPDVFRVGVASSGPHDLRSYLAYWGEKYQGPAGDPSYLEQSNADLADRLQGRLLLIHGDLDDNVHPAQTMRLVEALIEADRDFDLLILPNQNHDCTGHPYYVRRVWDHFVRHLAGVSPPR